MRLILQRTASAEVWINDRCHSQTGPGLLILVGTKQGDTEESCRYLADKAVNLRIFSDERGKMNLSALDAGAEIMVVSQFTLYADCRKGRRPGFSEAQEPGEAERLHDHFVKLIGTTKLTTKTGQFGASMQIKSTNHGPVTIILDHDA